MCKLLIEEYYLNWCEGHDRGVLGVFYLLTDIVMLISTILSVSLPKSVSTSLIP